jgi:hypothetical protein
MNDHYSQLFVITQKAYSVTSNVLFFYLNYMLLPLSRAKGGGGIRRRLGSLSHRRGYIKPLPKGRGAVIIKHFSPLLRLALQPRGGGLLR